MTDKAQPLNTNQLFSYLNRPDVDDFKFNPLFTTLFFPNVATFDTQKIMLDDLENDEVTMSAFCSPMVGSQVQRDKGYETSIIQPGYMKPKHEIDPSKTIMRVAGEDPAALNSPSYRRLRLITGNLRRQVKAIKARVEWLAVNAVTTGKNIIEGEGIERYEIDWKMPANCIIQQGPGKKWSEQDKETHDPTDDIELYTEQADCPANVMIMGANAWRLLRSFKKFRELYDLSRGSESAAELACKNLGEVVSFKGYLGDMALIVYSGKYTDGDGTEKYFLEPDLLVLGNTSNKGLVAYGAIMDQDAVRTGATRNMYYPKNWIEDGDPSIEYVQTHSAPQPVPADIRKFVTVKIG
ncbi:major capsid protein [Escherichia coli]|uniref:major capsid protein n=1 Tax=Escherichia coli TaxID=562 RepID=UPI000BE5D194|nr:major capsid protein [Escherichia coli]EFE8231331.1 major capsid protein [Escherichia coli]EKR5135510.1 major capsid protein [Escherichia coli]MBA5734891.1 major capsid protein [Escherichia coli]MBA5823304.1 major capsid protein [Escherichia coli]MBE9713020.1 major capsid protein [Escherichia coli]